MPRPLPAHLASAMLLWLSSRAGLTSLPGALPRSSAPGDTAESSPGNAALGRLAALAAEIGLRGPDAVAAALDRQLRRRAEAFLAGVEAYRRHPFHRAAARVPVRWRHGRRGCSITGAAPQRRAGGAAHGADRAVADQPLHDPRPGARAQLCAPPRARGSAAPGARLGRARRGRARFHLERLHHRSADRSHFRRRRAGRRAGRGVRLLHGRAVGLGAGAAPAGRHRMPGASRHPVGFPCRAAGRGRVPRVLDGISAAVLRRLGPGAGVGDPEPLHGARSVPGGAQIHPLRRARSGGRSGARLCRARGLDQRRGAAGAPGRARMRAFLVPRQRSGARPLAGRRPGRSARKRSPRPPSSCCRAATASCRRARPSRSPPRSPMQMCCGRRSATSG